MPTALTRPVSPLLGECELTHIERSPIDIREAEQQHAAYEKALEKMGYSVRQLPETPHLPDGVFVEDTAVVFAELGIITRPGAESRRPETETVAPILEEYRELRFIEAPGTMDGGDVLTLGKDVYVGVSRRTNEEGVRQFEKILTPFGYRVTGVPVLAALHLKTAVAVIEDDLLLINPMWLSPDLFPGHHCEPVHPDEPFGANVMRHKNMALCSSAFSYTAEWLSGRGYDLISVNQSEMAKAEAGLTCCSVIVL